MMKMLQTADLKEKELSHIVAMLSRLIEERLPPSVMVKVTPEIFQQKRKKDLEPVLKKYGKIVLNPDYSDVIELVVHSLNYARRLVDDYHAKKLEGVVSLEASQPVYALNNYSR